MAEPRRTAASDTHAADREIVQERVYDAPRALVWEAWTQEAQIAQWWGPNGFTTTTREMDVRPGGRWRFTMHGPDGTDYPNLIVYEEVVKPERLAFHHGGEDEYADIQFHTVVTFKDEGGKTRLTMRAVFPDKAARDFVVKEHGAIEGGKQTLARLAEHLKTM